MLCKNGDVKMLSPQIILVMSWIIQCSVCIPLGWSILEQTSLPQTSSYSIKDSKY